MWTIIDVKGRFKSKRKFAQLSAAMEYIKILRMRYPNFELKIVMEKGEENEYRTKNTD